MKKMLASLSTSAVYDEIISPIGSLMIIVFENKLRAILFDTIKKTATYHELINKLKKNSNDALIINTKLQLDEYFQGKRKNFDLPLQLDGTVFQVNAWMQLQKIPYAATISYAEQAQKIGTKNQARAVGLANSQNPLPIVLPCHRVIGSNGRLVGFGGGLNKKTYLLNLEQQHAADIRMN